MKTQEPTHPPQSHLAALALGKLSPRQRAPLEEHVSGCSTCAKFISETPRGTLVGLLQKAASTARAADASTPGVRNRSTLLGHRSMVATTGTAGQDQQPNPADEVIPQQLQEQTKYRVERLLGRGGMGAVYQAYHERMDRQVAIKIVNPALVDHPQALARFDQEVKAAAKLDHPNVARAYDADEFGSLRVLVMEFVPGQSLDRLLKQRGRLTPIEACRLIRQAMIGLDHANARGMVHRDLKPQNLMLTPHGNVKILDFGLAKLASEQQQAEKLTQTHAMMGTPHYLAPEQALDAAEADIRADIYSLGCTLYHLLAGAPPFDGNTEMKVLLAHQNTLPRPLCEVSPDVPRALSDLVDRMLAKNPDDRPQTPKEVAQALLPFAKGDVAVADGESRLGSLEAAARENDLLTPQPLARPASGGRGLWWWGGGGAAALLAMLLAAWAAGAFSVRTPAGTIVVERVPDDAHVLVDGSQVTVTRDGESLVISAVDEGEHRLKLVRDGREIWSSDVAIDFGGQKVKVRYTPAPASSSPDPAAADVAAETPEPEPAERSVAADDHPPAEAPQTAAERAAEIEKIKQQVEAALERGDWRAMSAALQRLKADFYSRQTREFADDAERRRDVAQEAENKVKQFLDLLHKCEGDDDYVRLHFLLQSVPDNVRNSAAWSEAEPWLQEVRRKAEEIVAARLVSMGDYSIVRDDPYWTAHPTLVSAERRTEIIETHRAATMLRVVAEDQGGGDTILVDVTGRSGLCIPTGSNSFGWQTNRSSGEPLVVAGQKGTSSRDRSKLSVYLGSWHHYPVRAPIELTEGQLISGTTVVLHKVPPEKAGSLKITLSRAESGDQQISGTAYVSLPGTTGSLSTTVHQDGAFDSGPIAPGEYTIHGSMRGVHGVDGSEKLAVEVVAGDATRIDVPIYRSRTVFFEWRFRTLDQGQAGPWSKGEFSLGTGTGWTPPQSWNPPAPNYLGSLSFWTSEGCALAPSNCTIARVAASKLPEGTASSEFSGEHSYDPCPIEPGAIYHIFRSGRFEAFLQVRSITPPPEKRVEEPKQQAEGPQKQAQEKEILLNYYASVAADPSSNRWAACGEFTLAIFDQSRKIAELKPPEGKSFDTQTGLAFGPRGSLVVALTGDGLEIHEVDVPQNAFRRLFVWKGDRARCIAVGPRLAWRGPNRSGPKPAGRDAAASLPSDVAIFVSCGPVKGRGTIVQVDGSGKPRGTVRTTQTASSLAIAADGLIAGCHQSGQLLAVDRKGNVHVRVLPGEVNHPGAVAVSPIDGSIVIADNVTDRIGRLHKPGSYQVEIVEPLRRDGDTWQNLSVAITSDGYLVYGTQYPHRVVRLTLPPAAVDQEAQEVGG